MTDLLVILLAFSQIPIIFIYTSQNLNHFFTQKAQNINPIWLEQHADFTSHILLCTIFKYFSSTLAVASLIAIIYFGYTTPSSRTFVALLMVPNFIWIGGFGIYMMLFQILVIKKIPAPEIRSASMHNRQLSNFLPIWVIYLVYVLLAFIITTYIWAYFSQVISTETTLRRLVGLGIFIIAMSMMIYKLLQNKVSELELWIGANGRKIEITIHFGLLYIGALLGINLILSDIFSIAIFTPLSFVLTAHICVQIYFIAYFFYTKNRNIYQTS